MALPAIIAAVTRAAGIAGGASGAGAAGAAGTATAASKAVAELTKVANAFNQVSFAAKQVAHWTGNLAGAITGKMVQALSLWAGWVQKAAAPIEQMVRIHNPAVANQFMIALNDAFGVVGRELVPVMNAFTQVARKVGNVMAGLEPVFRPAIAAIAKLVEVIGDEFAKSIRPEVFEMMAAVVTKVAEAATVAVRAVGMLVRAFNNFINPVVKLAKILGFSGSSYDDKASSVGAAARTAKFVQPKEIADDAIRSALMIGRERQNKTPEQALNSIDKNIEAILSWLRERKEAVEKRVEQARNAGVYVAPVPTLALERAAKWAFGR